MNILNEVGRKGKQKTQVPLKTASFPILRVAPSRHRQIKLAALRKSVPMLDYVEAVFEAHFSKSKSGAQ